MKSLAAATTAAVGIVSILAGSTAIFDSASTTARTATSGAGHDTTTPQRAGISFFSFFVDAKLADRSRVVKRRLENKQINRLHDNGRPIEGPRYRSNIDEEFNEGKSSNRNVMPQRNEADEVYDHIVRGVGASNLERVVDVEERWERGRQQRQQQCSSARAAAGGGFRESGEQVGGKSEPTVEEDDWIQEYINNPDIVREEQQRIYERVGCGAPRHPSQSAPAAAKGSLANSQKGPGTATDPLPTAAMLTHGIPIAEAIVVLPSTADGEAHVQEAGGRMPSSENNILYPRDVAGNEVARIRVWQQLACIAVAMIIVVGAVAIAVPLILISQKNEPDPQPVARPTLQLISQTSTATSPPTRSPSRSPSPPKDHEPTNGSISTIPQQQDGFQLTSFNADYYGGSRLFHSETVSRPSINYAWSDFHNISSEDFSAVWIGTLSIYGSIQSVDIAFAFGWGTAQLLIDGKEQNIDGSEKRDVTYALSVGTHQVKITYNNDWHTVQFNTQLESPPRQWFTTADAHVEISHLIQSNTGIIHVDAYESSDVYNDISLIVELSLCSFQSVFLVLSIYSSANWVIETLNHQMDIVGIAYASYEPATTVTVLQQVPTFAISDMSLEANSTGIIELIGRAPDELYYDYSMGKHQISCKG